LKTEVINDIYYICASNFLFSQSLNHLFTSYVELFIYSLGLIVYTVKIVVRSINNLYENDVKCKDCFIYPTDVIIISFALGIALYILILDIFFRIYVEKKEYDKINK
jgi:hypothetical protein